jgi:hypothetical protein
MTKFVTWLCLKLRSWDSEFPIDLLQNVDVDTESLASLESMGVDVDLNEGIKDEDLKVEALG